MSVIIVLLMASLSVAAFFLLAYWWSAHDGQFDDTYSPGHRILYDQDKNQESIKKS
ncbi:MAG: cbb3-type cytochrome oxidase assembly protein CcoS [Saprospiraceae bacterium]|nr:cbb3-type cytochrome oxidase assembly protein CcoS [Saprospiraceae bacterium]